MIISGLYTLLTVPVYGILYAYTAIGIFVALFLSWINVKKPVLILSKLWAKSVFLLMGKIIHVRGKENINKGEKYILIANHASLFDIVAIMSFYPEVSWFGHERLLRVPVLGKFLKMTDYVPFREPTVTNTRHMLEQLIEKANNRSVALFPEGTRTTSGKINPFYRGFIYLFRSREIGILPVTLNGFYNFKPKTRFYINFGSKLEIVIHKPIPREELINRSDSEITSTVKAVIESAYH
ncbi:MAG: 1-acyl-sn-glycerol-3-phosphate acyltransferase [Planctomycetaceae bacterium]|nr:MAG: 1-acyl-sn-glycerol-3-phosphate acyltransferase [Planctomycetaceae bacterium]